MKRIGIALAVLLIACVIFCFTAERDVDWYRNYVRSYGNVLIEAEHNPSLFEQWVLYRGAIDAVSADADKILFYLKHAPLEGHCALVYALGKEYQPSCLDFYDNWVRTRSDAAYSRWEGGRAGEAFINLHVLGEGFYLEEAYLPT